jgi:DNA-binding transcriptional LysR family regulator
MRLPDYEAWAIFAAVAEHRSFSAAAAALSLSKATVSKAVSRLEASLRTPLLHRTSRRLSLTEGGERLAEHARRIVAEGEAAEEAARADASSPVGLIRMAAPMSFGHSRVAPVLADFLVAHRRIEIDLVLSDAQQDVIAEGYDLALRIAALPDSSLRARKLRDVAVRIIASPRYLEEFGTPDHPSELESHCCLTYSLSPSPERWRFAGPNGETVLVRPRGALRVNNGGAMLPSLCAGLGIAMLPDFICDPEIENGRLTAILGAWRTAPIALHLVTPPGRVRPRRVELLIAFLASRLSLGNPANR